jgi:hypothetical protein
MMFSRTLPLVRVKGNPEKNRAGIMRELVI